MYRAHEPLGAHGKATTDGPEYDGGGLVLFHNEQFLGWLSEDLTPLLLQGVPIHCGTSTRLARKESI
ncbi:hypothetical protein PF005_g4771 [Phytophthora fragariae]|uniref:Uncharacterized protein n=2 Tax=Phytophthora fragariae TaxID=53985 RepID=A0A6A3YYL2_9STRA|nr:hypothetical protein PF003_g14408 [Phytophthora fragariae]KAE9130170.1 hypothetical protein PF010_g3944 [Phytophthora fragariae]KAE9130196.1 hypothetical protein PF007_g4592 [Phytophthora fragariae]KAE9153334.1 hypothetical protein PF006_g2548 [Phytophthora fragariae]KAE9227333.1 hypothetical protein PF005_g4771 [Phytophthora fragariae]